MRREHLDFPEAVRLLADRARIEITEEGGGLPRGRRERLMAAHDAASDFYHRYLTRSRDSEAVEAREYLAERGFGIEVARVSRWDTPRPRGSGAAPEITRIHRR
jgi:DNA primase